MTINDPVKFCAGLWDWGCLNGCFGDTKIKPTDVDGFVERKGKFLWLETKSPGVKIPYGQARTFKALVRTGLFVVFVIWGQTNKPQELLIMQKGKTAPKKQCDLVELRQKTSMWFDYVNRP
jgi:hypothetical protein